MFEILNKITIFDEFLNLNIWNLKQYNVFIQISKF